ncbi:GNAT family N-acetyltransferase [Natroniella acetigena]|uniref:GNAT family N-acetyltransferase n=1 Tax=Natroniella acetigena TaxID=52004 RepID=UPI00200A35A3|nr:GNAT family N-acetyltransferase [Natroniella acetigena]MCK8826849.1 GNAT family N-acetyltransferase [Natroniella acetigena]
MIIAKKKEINRLKVKQVSDEKVLKQALKLRQEVFVKEQKVPAKLEFDGKDKEAAQFIAQSTGKIVGTCRLLTNGKVGKIERMAVIKECRGQGVGSALLTEVIKVAKKRSLSELIIHAQLQVKDFYLNHDFEVISDQVFTEAGSKHVKMGMKL